MARPVSSDKERANERTNERDGKYERWERFFHLIVSCKREFAGSSSLCVRASERAFDVQRADWSAGQSSDREKRSEQKQKQIP